MIFVNRKSFTVGRSGNGRRLVLKEHRGLKVRKVELEIGIVVLVRD